MPQTDAFDSVIPCLIQAGYLMAYMAGFTFGLLTADLW